MTLTPSFFGRFFSEGAEQAAMNTEQDVSGPLVFAGLEDRFFAGIFLPDSPDPRLASLRGGVDPAGLAGRRKGQTQAAGRQTREPERQASGFPPVRRAPRTLDVLSAMNPPLDSLVDFGWFSIVAKPLFIALRYIYDHWVHNYGWAIVLLTLIITTAMFPLKLKSLRSAQEMQKVAPIIKGIQDKYKNYKFNDPRKQKMNEEVMKVYSEHGINPLGRLPAHALADALSLWLLPRARPCHRTSPRAVDLVGQGPLRAGPAHDYGSWPYRFW